MGEKRIAYRILVEKPEKKPLRRARLRWVNNIKIVHREIRWDVMDWIDLAHDRDLWRALVSTIMNLGKFLNSYIIGCFSRRAQLHE
jgi:hypothetical protein